MKKNFGFIAFIALFMFLGGCTDIYYPDGFITLIKFESDIVDVEEMQIPSKDELIRFVDTIFASKNNSLMI